MGYIGRNIGNYCIEEKIASGSFGTAFLARHLHLKRRTAVIKILHAVNLGSNEEKEQFLQEAQFLEILKGFPNILPLLDFGIDDDVPYMVTEYAQQGSLRMRIQQSNGPLLLDEALAIVEQVGKGLQYAHDQRDEQDQSRGIIHRDLKPENILFNAKGEALLADFGMATILSSDSVKQTHIAGTPAYMAPEQFRGEVCKESDQYALACIAYELLTGHKVFDAPNSISMGFLHTTEPPIPPRQLNPQIPEAVERAILKALSKDRTERYPSVSAFVDTLDIRGESIEPGEENTVSREVQPTASEPLPTVLVPPPVSDQEPEILVPAPVNMARDEQPVLVGVPGNSPLQSKKPPKKRPARRFIIILLVLLTIVVLSATLIPPIYNAIWPPSSIGKDGIGVTSVNREEIGISDGRYALDTDPNWINKDAIALKNAASESLKNGNWHQAITQWNQAHEKDTRDAESLIYVEDQNVLHSGDPHITVVLGVTLGVNDPDGFSQDVLQGAYVHQMECNKDLNACGGHKLRLLIARSGSIAGNSQLIAQQIVQAAQFDKTIVAVQGWTSSATTEPAVQTLDEVKLPMISASSTADSLTGKWPYFFRTSVPNAVEAPFVAQYVKEKLQSKTIVLFKDPNEPYSKTLSQDLTQQLTIQSTESFTTTNDAKSVIFAQKVRNVLDKYNPDLILFPTRDVNDIIAMLNAIPDTPQYANLKVFSGGAAYELANFTNKPSGYNRIIFAVSAYPDEWSILAPQSATPPFFGDYSSTYDPGGDHPGIYRYSRPSYMVMLTYDAISAILEASKIASKQHPTSVDIQKALLQVSFQGVSGKISFGKDGNPVHKVQILIHVVDPGYNRMAAYQGCFLASSGCTDNSIHILE